MEPQEQIEKYKMAFDLAKYYNDNLRRTISDFVLMHTILFAFILTNDFFREPGPALFSISFFGIILCFFWYCDIKRFRQHRSFRFRQARAAEPDGWNLLGGDGINFYRGQEIRIGSESFKMDRLGRFIDNKDVEFLIFGFACIYLVLLVKSVPGFLDFLRPLPAFGGCAIIVLLAFVLGYFIGHARRRRPAVFNGQK